MRTYIFEGVQDAGTPLNWGKFLVGVPDMEWSVPSVVDPGNPRPLLGQIGWEPEEIWVCDLQTREGAFFWPGGNAREDLERHRIWVCPLFEEFLIWLYRQDIHALHLLPRIVELPDTQFSINGYRRLGPHDVSFTLRKGDIFTVEWGGEPRPVICEDITYEGALVRGLTDAETAQLEELIGQEEEESATTVTFKFLGTEVTVDPDGKIIPPREEEAPGLDAPDAAANTARRAAETGLERAPEDADTTALDLAADQTTDLPAVDITAIEPPKPPGKPARPAKPDKPAKED